MLKKIIQGTVLFAVVLTASLGCDQQAEATTVNARQNILSGTTFESKSSTKISAIVVRKILEKILAELNPTSNETQNSYPSFEIQQGCFNESSESVGGHNILNLGDGDIIQYCFPNSQGEIEFYEDGKVKKVSLLPTKPIPDPVLDSSSTEKSCH
jgi:hypothetical protein